MTRAAKLLRVETSGRRRHIEDGRKICCYPYTLYRELGPAYHRVAKSAMPKE